MCKKIPKNINTTWNNTKKMKDKKKLKKVATHFHYSKLLSKWLSKATSSGVERKP